MTLVQDRYEAVSSLPLRGQVVIGQVVIGEEQASDVIAREALLDAAFGRKERLAKTCQKLRAGRVPARGLSLVAREGTALIGTLRLWHVDAGGVPALLLGPLAVSAAHRSLGLGSMLMDEGLRRARDFGHSAVILIGDAAYYEKFGFSRDVTGGLTMPGPIDEARFLGLEFKDRVLGAAQGLVVATGALDLDSHRDHRDYASAA
jgi:predicted N-acetyltransferase YhbS